MCILYIHVFFSHCCDIFLFIFHALHRLFRVFCVFFLFVGVFSLGVPVDALFFIGNQLVATSHTGKVGVWNAVTQHWQVCLIQFSVPVLIYSFCQNACEIERSVESVRV